MKVSKKSLVLDLHKLHPEMTTVQLAERVGCSPDYVRGLSSQLKLGIRSVNVRGGAVEARAKASKAFEERRRERERQRQEEAKNKPVFGLGRGNVGAKSAEKLQQRVALDTPKQITHLRKNGKLFVYWKLDPMPKITFVQNARGDWTLGSQRWASALMALAWACEELLSKNGEVDPAAFV
ncbi:hypothetical protein [Brucella intermedia]|uniref:hypothetical protein n=1 Tax=Brucella intermedia TaxID=94625 RepID=UPI00224B5D5A|nr:hypothetical protein [Brucella intermedia]